MGKSALVALATAAASGATLAGPAGAHADPEAVYAAAPPWPTTPGVRHFGVMADAGAPDGAQVSLVVRPVRAIRLHGGVGYNGISSGLEGGISLVPFRTWFTPTLNVDYGSFPDGDATRLARLADPSASSPALRRVGYRFANARVGLEVGRKRATFYIHAGVSHITGTLHDAAAALDDSTTVMVTTTDPRIEAWTVSARVGLVVYFGP